MKTSLTDSNRLRQLALALPHTAEEPHFEKVSFRVAKKIFATCDAAGHATLRLSPADQAVFSTFDAAAVHPVPNSWGKQGWTNVVLSRVPEALLSAMLRCAWQEVAPRKLHALLPPESESD